MKIRVLKATLPTYWYASHIGEVFDVEKTREGYRTIDPSDEEHGYVEKSDFVFVEDNKTLELIANLSAEVARLSKRVETLELATLKQKAPVGGQIGRKLTREEVVENAQADVEGLKDGRYYAVEKHNGIKNCNAEFIVNREKRTVVCLLRGVITKKIHAKGIAKCTPTDCFNVHIGKAITLRRALGLEVPQEYTDAPAPEGVKVGDIVDTYFKDETFHKRSKVAKIKVFAGEIRLYEREDTKQYTPFEEECGDRVIDDSDRF